MKTLLKALDAEAESIRKDLKTLHTIFRPFSKANLEIIDPTPFNDTIGSEGFVLYVPTEAALYPIHQKKGLVVARIITGRVYGAEYELHTAPEWMIPHIVRRLPSFLEHCRDQFQSQKHSLELARIELDEWLFSRFPHFVRYLGWYVGVLYCLSWFLLGLLAN